MAVRRLKISVLVLCGVTLLTCVIMTQRMGQYPIQRREGTPSTTTEPDGVFTYDLRSNLSILEIEAAVRSGHLPLKKALPLIDGIRDLLSRLEKYIESNNTVRGDSAMCSPVNVSSGGTVSSACSEIVPSMINRTVLSNKTTVELFSNSLTLVPNSSSVMEISKIRITLPDPKNPTVKKIFQSYDKRFNNRLMTKVNPEGIRYSGPNIKFRGSPTMTDVMCRMKKANVVKTLTRTTSPFDEVNISDNFPNKTYTEMYNFSRCAVVGSSFHLNQSRLGEAIDNHDIVLRFNNAPTVGFEKDVGKKTTFRVINSEAFGKMCGEGSKFCPTINETLLIWRTGPYNGNLYRWYIHAKGQALFSKYLAWRTAFPSQDIYLIHPQSLWLEWDTLAFFSTKRVKPIVPSSGFTGIAVLLGICDTVDVYGYIGDDLPAYLCHYYDDFTSCKGGQWHPTSNEKAIIKVANVGSSASVMTLKGYNQFNCTR
ncbi:beta-galactoside alpha-2,6-sialyltransferase 1-like [Ptychodera flava]|uniref:beta-galactoside alpha-2,6-sialyltransferase 1-like n=1 Tax=Ptychodera flava TaxID=63121 RepID=UPI003969EB90